MTHHQKKHNKSVFDQTIIKIEMERTWTDQVVLGDYTLQNRIALAAMTRGKCADDEGIPNELHREYYSQRAGAGLVLTESTYWSPRGVEFSGGAGLYGEKNVVGWRAVTDAVHAKGSRIYVELTHAGRVTHSSKIGGLETWGPSAIQPRDKVLGTDIDLVAPKEMTIEDIEFTKGEFQATVIRAIEANFDGILLHGGYGMLVEQFLKSESNKRTDQYGGSAENRARFALELVDIALKHLKSYQVGVKVTPVSTAKDSYDANPIETYTYLIQELSKRNIGFIELVESSDAPSKNVYPQTQKEQIPSILQAFRPHFKGIVIGNNGFDQNTGLKAIQSGLADIISFARSYVSNPDLAERIIKKQELNGTIDWANIGGYQAGAKGYTDYPVYSQ